VLNANKTKAVLFSNKRNSTAITPNLVTLQGNLKERVALGALLDEHLNFKAHIQNLAWKL